MGWVEQEKYLLAEKYQAEGTLCGVYRSVFVWGLISFCLGGTYTLGGHSPQEQDSKLFLCLTDYIRTNLIQTLCNLCKAHKPVQGCTHP
jgi:hypothetical protein